MMRQHRSQRSGTALVLTLAIMVLVLTTIAAAASRAATVQFEREIDRSTRIANELLRAAEPTILTWLETESSGIALSPDAAAPEVPVLHDVWILDGRTVELRLTAWDQCGMVNLDTARTGSPLRLTLPEAVLRQLSDTATNKRSRPGLDLFSGDSPASSVRPFPVAAVGKPTAFRTHPTQSAEPIDTQLPVASSSHIAFGALLATHQSGQSDEEVTSPRINVNTAPMALVEASLREAGRGGLEAIAASREQEQPVAIGSLPRLSGLSQSDGRPQPVLLGSSDVWAFRIDIRIDRVTRSWWRIYQTTSSTHQPSRSRTTSGHSESSWMCVQSIVITN